MTNAIELNHISKSFGEFSLKDVTLAVPAGTICGLVGENGAGKSTLIRILMGALRPDSGTAAALGVDVSAPEFLNAKEDIGVVLDEAYFPESLNALQVGGVMAKTYRRWDGKQYQNYLTRFGLPEKKPFKDFSRGMKMKLAIAVALSHSPRLLVLDEATAGLDPIVRDEILELFNEFTRDETHSVLISSHILSDLEKLCDYIAFLHQGRLLFCEEKDALLEQYGIFNDTVEQAEALMPEAIVSMETTPYGGVRALVRRELAPVGFQLEKPTIEDKIQSLKTDNIHGRCVWDCEHTVVDHQSVAINFADGATATLNMIGGTAKAERNLHIIGTKGEIKGVFDDSVFTVRTIDTASESGWREEVVDLAIGGDKSGMTGSHGGGDLRLVEDFVRVLQGEQPSISCTNINDSLNGHLAVFRAEKSRRTGTVAEMPQL